MKLSVKLLVAAVGLMQLPSLWSHAVPGTAVQSTGSDVAARKVIQSNASSALSGVYTNFAGTKLSATIASLTSPAAVAMASEAFSNPADVAKQIEDAKLTDAEKRGFAEFIKFALQAVEYKINITRVDPVKLGLEYAKSGVVGYINGAHNRALALAIGDESKRKPETLKAEIALLISSRKGHNNGGDLNKLTPAQRAEVKKAMQDFQNGHCG